MEAPNVVGELTKFPLPPTPVQPELPMWTTCTRALDVFGTAGAGGFNVLTGLVFLTANQLAQAIRIYRGARADCLS